MRCSRIRRQQRWLEALRNQSPAFQFWSDEDLAQGGLAALAVHTGLLDEARFFAGLLAHGGATCLKISIKLADLVEVAQGAGTGRHRVAAEWWQRLAGAVATKGGAPRSVKWEGRAFGSRVDDAGGVEQVAKRWQALVVRVQECWGLVLDSTESLPLNLDLVSCASSFACTYQSVKQDRGVLDFVDLEAMAARLLRDEALSAYLQLRLDRRYRHLLFDEFQDTSSLQWTVIRTG